MARACAAAPARLFELAFAHGPGEGVPRRVPPRVVTRPATVHDVASHLVRKAPGSALFWGEVHGQPGVVAAAAAAVEIAAGAGAPLVVGLEQCTPRGQGSLDSWLHGGLTDAGLLDLMLDAAEAPEDRFRMSAYAQLAAAGRGAPVPPIVVGLSMPRMAASQARTPAGAAAAVARGDISGIPVPGLGVAFRHEDAAWAWEEAMRRQMPGQDGRPQPGRHAWFWEFATLLAAAHGSPSPSARSASRIFPAQAAKDFAMAASLLRATSGLRGGAALALTGNGHVHWGLGLPEAAARLAEAQGRAVLPLVVTSVAWGPESGEQWARHCRPRLVEVPPREAAPARGSDSASRSAATGVPVAVCTDGSGHAEWRLPSRFVAVFEPCE